MSGILEIFGLKKHLNLTVNMEKSKFIESLKLKVKPNSLFFFDIFDSEQKEFYGKVSENDFWLRKADRLIPRSPFARAYGKTTDKKGKTEINIRIIGWHWFIILWFIGLTSFLSLIIVESITSNTLGLLIVFGPVFLFFYIYAFYKLRSGVKKLENYILTELELN